MNAPELGTVSEQLRRTTVQIQTGRGRGAGGSGSGVVWNERSWLGMPLANLGGWVLCGASFMAVSRLLWGGDLDDRAVDRRWVFSMYVVNVMFGVLLCASLGLWQPILLAALAGLLPAALVGAERVDGPATAEKLAAK